MGWLEVALVVDGELAEAVADVLARFAPGGVTTEQTVAYLNPEDEGSPAGPVTVRAYLPGGEALAETRRRLEEALFYLGMIHPLPGPIFTPIEDQDWMQAWKLHYQPIPIGRRLIIVPAWLESPEPARIPVRIDPGMAFGTGTHPSTQLCLELLEEFFDRPGISQTEERTAIDIGCGSGILSIAALKLGAACALGVDIDPAALRAARENADANRIDRESLLLGIGSVEEILAGRFPLQRGSIVLANILASVLVRLLASGLAEVIAPGGRIILSGILQEQAGEVAQAACARQLINLGEKRSGDWVALQFARPET
jgi:ribosomal protein L11 methyltransferase